MRSSRIIVRILLWATTAGFLVITQPSSAQQAGSQSRFQRTVEYLQTASSELRGDFAAIALSNLADAYIAEAQLARAQTGGGHNANLRGWSVMVDYYARQMPAIVADIELGLPVQLTIGAEQELAITVADRTVLVSPPRLNQQSAFEQGILADFCRTHDCEQISPVKATLASVPVATATVRPEFTFSAQGLTCSHEGLQLQFASEHSLANARQVCEQFFREVVLLTDELAWQQRHGVAIEWEALDIQTIPDRPEYMVPLNSVGDSLVLAVPLMYRSTGLLHDVLPWIRSRLGGQQQASMELKANAYGWQEP